MAEQQQHGQHVHQAGQHAAEGLKSALPDSGPSGSQVLAVATLLPVGGILLALSCVTLTGTFVGLAVATPLFVIFSPVLVPAFVLIGLAVAGFLTSGALGLTGVTSLSWILKYVRGARQRVPEQMEHARRRMAEAGPKAKEAGHGIQSRAHEEKRT